MAKLLKDSTAKELTEMIQERRDRKAKNGARGFRNARGWVLLKLVADQGDDIWTSKAVIRNRTTNPDQWDDITDGREPEVYVETGGKVDQIVRAFPSVDTEGNPLWIAIPGGGSGTVKILINGSTTSDTYTGNIVNNRTDKTVIESGVTVKLLDHDGGTLSASDDIILDCTFDSDNEWYEAVNYNYFYPG